MLFEKKKMPIGIDLFETIREEEWYYVDKTGFIADLLKNRGQVNLLTRPRRFGKTLNMSMLKCFFEIGGDPGLFKGLAIEKETEVCEKHMGQYPVIFISLKGADGMDINESMFSLYDLLWNEVHRFAFLEHSDKLDDDDKIRYRRTLDGLIPQERSFAEGKSAVANALKTISDLLFKHYGKKVIILIDEYDVPMQKAYENGFGKEMTSVIRAMFQNALKTNGSLEFAVLTGCLRVSKESLFTGLNNMKMFTLLNERCDEWFGFTDAEVREMLEYYGCEKYYDLTRQWYDGYLVGGTNVYNPWDVINWVDGLCVGSDYPMSFWLNTSGVGVVRKFIEKMDTANCGDEVEELISGGSVRKTINEQLTYEDLYDNLDNIWSLLFATGYLTPESRPQGNLVMLKIPNEEVRELFVNDVLGIFKEELPTYADETLAFGEAIKSGDADKAQELLEKFMGRTVSIRDTASRKIYKENLYHGILIGLFGSLRGWRVESNKQVGEGFCDIAIRIGWDIGIIIELKYAEGGNMDAACADALAQIENRRYIEDFKRDEMGKIIKYGIAFYRNKCKVAVGE